MKAGAIFLATMLILIIFNFIYVSVTPDEANNIILGALIGLLITVIATGVISGITVLGSGLNSTSIKIIFGTSALLNILFAIQVEGFQIGLGLINNLINAFSAGDFWGLGFFLSSTLAIMALISGIMMLVGGSDL